MIKMTEVSFPFHVKKIHAAELGVWRVESFGEDGEWYIAEFISSQAEERAMHYYFWICTANDLDL